MKMMRLFFIVVTLTGILSSCGNTRRISASKASRPPSPTIEHELLGNGSTKVPERKETTESASKNLYSYIEDWKGTPHVMGGESKTGVDCSGLVCRVYADVYSIELRSRRAADIFKELERIERKDLREGDLVFFKIRRSGIDHVGIYLSDDNFVHTSSSRGVMVSNLNEPYFRERFFAGGRKPELMK